MCLFRFSCSQSKWFYQLLYNHHIPIYCIRHTGSSLYRQKEHSPNLSTPDHSNHRSSPLSKISNIGHISTSTQNCSIPSTSLGAPCHPGNCTHYWNTSHFYLLLEPTPPSYFPPQSLSGYLGTSPKYPPSLMPALGSSCTANSPTGLSSEITSLMMGSNQTSNSCSLDWAFLKFKNSENL